MNQLYILLFQKRLFRIDNEPELFTVFDIGFLETIYNEIYEVTGDLGTENVRVGDFLENVEMNITLYLMI